MRRYFVILFLLSFSSAALAQTLRYIDDSGNIHWVDSVTQIPPRYRNQVVPPTPAPTGKVKVQRPTPTPRPTKTPKIKKTPTPKPKKTRKGSIAEIFPEGKPGVLPTEVPKVRPTVPMAPPTRIPDLGPGVLPPVPTPFIQPTPAGTTKPPGA